MKKLLYILPIVLLMSFYKTGTTHTVNSTTDSLSPDTIWIDFRAETGLHINGVKINRHLALDSLEVALGKPDSTGGYMRYGLTFKPEGESKRHARSLMFFIFRPIPNPKAGDIVVMFKLLGDKFPLDFPEGTFKSNYDYTPSMIGYKVVGGTQHVYLMFDKETHKLRMMNFFL